MFCFVNMFLVILAWCIVLLMVADLTYSCNSDLNFPLHAGRQHCREESTLNGDATQQEPRIVEADRLETVTKPKSRQPTFSEPHFWGFGWWENVIKRKRK